MLVHYTTEANKNYILWKYFIILKFLGNWKKGFYYLKQISQAVFEDL